MTIIDQLHTGLDEPDIVTLLLSSLSLSFHQRFPTSHIQVSAEEDPDAIIVTVTSPAALSPTNTHTLIYKMGMSDSWENTPSFKFTFTNTANPHDHVIVDIGS